MPDDNDTPMPLNNQPDERDLISTEEAKQLIDLYAQRERQRLKEAERIANMPKLADIASLLGTTVEQLRPMLSQVYVEHAIWLTLDANGEEHLSQEEANDLIEYANYVEEQRQKELERKASMTSVQEVAANLGITEEEAQSLLKEVRGKKPPELPLAPPIIPTSQVRPTVKAHALPAEEPKQDPYATEQADGYDSLMNRSSYVDTNDKRAQEASAVILIVVLLFVLLLIFAFAGKMGSSHYYSPSPSYYQPYSQPYTYPTSTQPVTTQEPLTQIETYNLGQAVPGTMTLNGPMPPQGWTVKVYGPTRMLKVAAEKGEAEPKLAVEAQLRESVRSLINFEADMQGPATVDTAVPLSPAAEPLGTSDIGQWASVVATDGKTTRMVYLPLSSNLSKEQASDVEQRLDYLVGKSSSQSLASKYPPIKDVPSVGKLLPEGFRLTASIQTQYYQANGKAFNTPTINNQTLLDNLEKATIKFIGELEAKRAFASVDLYSAQLVSTIYLRYPRGYIPVDINTYLDALRNGSAEDKAMAKEQLRTRLQVAANEYQSKNSRIR